MQTRSDQYMAYKYLIRRVLTSMTGDSPDSPEQPFRRLLIGTFAGLLVMLLAGVVVALIAYASKGGNDQWYKLGDNDKTGKVVVEKDSGTLYVLVPPEPEDRRGKPQLRAVENFPSAQLVIGKAAPTKESVSQDVINEISGKKRIVPGPRVGIPDAPSSLPSKDNLVQKDSFQAAVCSRDGAGHEVDVILPKERRFADAESAGGIPVFVRAPNNKNYLIYKGKKLEVTENAMLNLKYNHEPIAVGANWITSLPNGKGGAGPAVSGQGTAPYDVNGQQVALGQVFFNKSNNQYFLADRQLRSITEVEARLLTADGKAEDASGTAQTMENLTQIDSAEVSRLRPKAVESSDLPPRMVDALTVDNPDRTTLCAWFDGSMDPTNTEITHGGALPNPNQASRSARAGEPNVAMLANNTLVPAGSGAVVRSATPKDKNDVAFWVITSDGKKYAMPRTPEDVVTILGYGEVNARQLSWDIVRMIPTGPALTREAAGAPVVQQPPAAGQAGN